MKNTQLWTVRVRSTPVVIITHSRFFHSEVIGPSPTFTTTSTVGTIHKYNSGGWKNIEHIDANTLSNIHRFDILWAFLGSCSDFKDTRFAQGGYTTPHHRRIISGGEICSTHSIQGTVVSCRDMSCSDMSCRDISCRDMSCRDMSCRDMSCRDMSGHGVSCRAMPCCDISCRAV